MKKTCFLMILLACAATSKAATLTANFDSFQEGYSNVIIYDGGITFSEYYDYADWSTSAPLSIEDASAQASSEFAGMSSPNVLGFGSGYVPGPYSSWGRFGSMKIDFEGTASMVSMDLFVAGGPDESRNQLTLQAFLGSSLVTQRIIPISTSFEQHLIPTISNSKFDSLRLIASGPVENGASFIAIDNVQITLIPEPATLALLALGGLVLRKRK